MLTPTKPVAVPDYSFIILTYNEEIHLPRLISSLSDLKAPVFIFDSGSSDNTSKIAHEYGAAIKVHPFENHPKQWHAALKAFPVTTPWVICLDADQYLSPELFQLLHQFNSVQISDAVTGIYFNRKNE